MQANPDTAVVVPAYNEAGAIGGVVDELRTGFDHVICVDDGSSDATSATAESAGALVLKHVHNLGQGAALQTGLTFALSQGYTYAITFDADGQHRVSDALTMLERARRTGVDVILGSRFLNPEDEQRIPTPRRMVLRAATVVTRASSGLAVTDTHNGLRVLGRQALESLQVTINGMAHASQLLDQIGARQLTWLEHPVTIDYTDYSKNKGQSNINAINVSFDLLLHKITSPRHRRIASPQ